MNHGFPYNFIEMPDEVINELFLMESGDFDYDEFSTPAMYPPRPSAPIKTTSCEFCEHGGLTWKNTKFGWRLTYAYGPLKGKIHGCETVEYDDERLE